MMDYLYKIKEIIFNRYNKEKTNIKERIDILLLSSLVKILHQSALLDDNIQGEAKDTSSVEDIITRAYHRRNYGEIKNNLEFSCFLTEAIAVGHPFNDGNKRTAALLLQFLVNDDPNNAISIERKDNKFEYENIIINIVNHKSDYHDLVDFLSKKIKPITK